MWMEKRILRERNHAPLVIGQTDYWRWAGAPQAL
jgi:hypothetical protein